MARSKPKLQTPESATADDVEAAFYEALQSGNVEQLMALWVDEADIACIHPGGARLRGPVAIRASFEAMFADGAGLKASVGHVNRLESVASAVHHVLERIEVMTPQGPAFGYVIATNVYMKTAHGWRMVLHHASPGTEDAALEVSEAPTVLH